MNLDSDLIDLVTLYHVSTDFGKEDMLDIAIMQALPELFNEDFHDNRTQNFVWTLEKTLSAANVKLITKHDDDNFNKLCTLGISICIEEETCHCSGGFKIKRNIISDDKTPFSKDCPRTITRVCYHGKCYCQHHQNIFKKKRDAKKFKAFSGGSTADSSASISWYNNNLKFLCYLFVIISFLLS